MSSTDQIFKTTSSEKREASDETRDYPHKRANVNSVSEDDPTVDEDDPRFYGNDIDSSLQGEILDYIESKEKNMGQIQEEETFHNLPFLKRIISKFLKQAQINAELREKFPDEPLKFFESEEELNQRLKDLSIISDIGLYREAADEEDFCLTLVSLLEHENDDICLQTISTLLELIDLDSDTNNRSETIEFLKRLLECGVLGAIEGYLERIERLIEYEKEGGWDKYKDEERAVLDFLGIFSDEDDLTENVFDRPYIINYLLKRIQIKETGQLVSENKLTSVMTLFGLVSNPALAKRLVNTKYNGVDILLEAAAGYIYEDPQPYDTDELYAKCIFDILRIVSEYLPERFNEAEGPELMVKLLKDANWAVIPALEVLQSILKVSGYPAIVIVDSDGLKPLFKKFYETQKSRDKNVISILSNMLRWLELDSSERIRLMGKFSEKNYRAVKSLIQVRNKTAGTVKSIRQRLTDLGLEESHKNIDLAEQKLEAIVELEEVGVSKQNDIDIILGWISIESDKMRKDVETVLKPVHIEEIYHSLRSYALELHLLIKAQEDTPMMSQKDVDLLKMDEDMVQTIADQMEVYAK